MAGPVLVWDVACPGCGAGASKRCRNRFGDLKKFHVARIRAAAAAAERELTR